MNLGGTANLFSRPLGAPLGPALGLGDAPSSTVSSTSPSPGALFAQPLFKGLPKLSDGSPEDPAVLSTSATLGGIQVGTSSSTSMGGGPPGLFFGPLGGVKSSAVAATLLASGEGEDHGGTSDKAASSLRAGQISTGFLPLGGGSSGKMGGPPPLLGFGTGAGNMTTDQP